MTSDEDVVIGRTCLSGLRSRDGDEAIGSVRRVDILQEEIQ